MLSFLGLCLEVMTWSELWQRLILTMGWFGSYFPGTANSNSWQRRSLGETY